MSDLSILQKQCPRCKNILPHTIEFFRICRREKDGLTHACRDCLRKQDAKYLDEHREENKEHSKKRYYDKPEARLEYRANNADKIAEGKRDWRKRNPDLAKKHKMDSQRRHPESHARRHKRYAVAHPERIRANTMVRIARKKGAEGKYSDADIFRLYQEQDGMCAYCGIRIYLDIPYDAHVDHVHPLIKGGSNWPDNLALACAYCNVSKNDYLLTDWMLRRDW